LASQYREEGNKHSKGIQLFVCMGYKKKLENRKEDVSITLKRNDFVAGEY
jgi:hypothetical protein